MEEYTWPIIFLKWSAYRVDLAKAHATNDRALRRWQRKAMKAARLNRTSVSPKMPGAWPG